MSRNKMIRVLVVRTIAQQIAQRENDQRPSVKQVIQPTAGTDKKQHIAPTI
jgi:hypothetical protein